MNAGAFSNDKVVAAAQRVVPILVDCSAKGQNEELQQKYGVQGYPTAIYVDPEGKQIREMGSRDAGAIVSEIEGMAKKYPGRPSIWQGSFKAAVALGKQAKRPVAVYVADPKDDLLKLNAKLMKDLGDRKTKFLWVLEIGHEAALKTYGVEAAPAVIVVDPKAEDPLKEPLGRLAIKADEKADVLNKALDEAHKSYKK